MTHEEAEQLLGFRVNRGWTFHKVMRCGKLAGFVMQMGNEVHVHRCEEFKGRWFTRQDVERILLPILNEYGSITTAVRKDNAQGHRFVQRGGFKPVGATSTAFLYRLERLNHARL